MTQTTLRLARQEMPLPAVPEASPAGVPDFPEVRPGLARVLIARAPAATPEPAPGQLQATLARGGFACAVVHSTEAILEALRDGDFDLLCCDLELAGGDDLDVVREAAGVSNGLPVIVTATRPTTASAVAAIDLPVVAYLVEPVDPVDLLVRAERAIVRARTVRAVRAAERELAGWRDGLASRATPANGLAVSTALDSFLARTLHNVVGSLADIEHARSALGREHPPAPHACQTLNCPRGAQLREAVRHTINVLEATKGSFRSRTLAELRHRLELLLEHN